MQTFVKISEDVKRRGNPGTAAYIVFLSIPINDTHVLLNLDFVRLFARKIYFFIVCFIAGNYKQTGGRASASANFANSGRNFQNWAFNLTFLNARSTYTRNIFQINSDQSTSQPLLTTMISSFLAFRLNYLFYNIQLHIIILWFWKAFLRLRLSGLSRTVSTMAFHY